jgi:hypothetical protein
MTIGSGDRFILNFEHPEIMRAVLAQIVRTGDVLGRAGPGRTILAVAVDDWVIDELAALQAEGEDGEAEADEDDDPAESEC